MDRWNLDNLRIVQYNLQIKDTAQMVPEEIAESVERLHANAVVLNVGGIYAWYPSKIKYHHINEYLPSDRPLLKEIIERCHERNIRVIGRFDFSKTDDVVYLNRPDWFVQDAEGQPLSFGSKRMGEWSLLMSTCINGGYRNEELAVPVLQEAVRELDMDGIFFNAPQMERCFCENCRRKYRKLYGQNLPENPALWDKEWSSLCLKDNMGLLQRAVKDVNPHMPTILYYGTYQNGKDSHAENLDFRYATADYVCTEAQDVLSSGLEHMPEIFRPTLTMKLGESVPGYPRPFGIIHSCPGMAWRHSGLPAAEYEFWMSQVPAAGGQLWHSLTGFDATIADRRLLPVAARMDQKAAAAAARMQGAVSGARVLLLWNGGVSDQGMVQAMMQGHIPFDVMDVWHPDAERMKGYDLVIVPDRFPVDEKLAGMLREYAGQGGSVFLEKTDADGLEYLNSLLGIEETAVRGRNLAAAYGFAEPEGGFLNEGLEGTSYIPVKGDVLYVRRAGDAKTCMTLVPPFAPLDGVGAPPERASMPVKHTDIPLILEHRIEKGRVISAFFGLSELIRTVGHADDQMVFENCVKRLLGEKWRLEAGELPAGVFVYHWKDGKKDWIHLVNGIGSRPLRSTYVCRELRFCMKAAKEVLSVRSVLDGAAVEWSLCGDRLEICVSELKVWDMIEIEWK